MHESMLKTHNSMLHDSFDAQIVLGLLRPDISHAALASAAYHNTFIQPACQQPALGSTHHRWVPRTSATPTMMAHMLKHVTMGQSVILQLPIPVVRQPIMSSVHLVLGCLQALFYE